MRKWMILTLLVLATAAVFSWRNFAYTSKAVTTGETTWPCVEMPTNEHEHRFRPSCSGESRAGDYRAEVRINAQHIRGPDYAPHPPPGVIRILILGASNILGLGIPEAETFPRRLEEKLTRKYRRRFEVLNGAMFGYSAWQAATRLHPLVQAYRPHLVLYHLQLPAFLLFDAAWEPRLNFSPEGRPLSFDRSILGRETSWPRVNQWLFRNTSVFLFLHTLHDQWRRIRLTREIESEGGEKAARRFLASTLRAIEYMRTESMAGGADFSYFSEPYHEYFYGQFVLSVMHFRLAQALSVLMPKPSFSFSQMNQEFAESKAPFLFLHDFSPENYLMEKEGVHLTPEGLEEWSEVFIRDSERLPFFRALGRSKGK